MLVIACNYYLLKYKYPQDMFKNVPHVKIKCGNKIASETFD